MLGPGSFLIGTGFMECHQQIGAVVMLTISVGLCGFHFSGYFINHGDIAPAFAGTMFGISNTAATVPGILAPFVVSALTPNVGHLSGAFSTAGFAFQSVIDLGLFVCFVF